MRIIDPSKVISALNKILPDYPKTNNLVSGIHDMVVKNNNLKSLLLEHSDYISKTEDELSDDLEYNLTLEIYYYSCLFDLPSKYTLEEIFSIIDYIPAYDLIDKTLFRVLYKIISIEEAIDLFYQEIKAKNLISIKERKNRVLIKWHSESDLSENITRPNEKMAEYFRDSKIILLENLFIFLSA